MPKEDDLVNMHYPDSEEWIKGIVALYLKAMSIFEACDLRSAIVQSGISSGTVFAQKGHWHQACCQFRSIGIFLVGKGFYHEAKISFSSSILCYFGLFDIVGAENAMREYDDLNPIVAIGPSDILFNALLEAYTKWDSDIISIAITTFQRGQQFQPWQFQCLAAFQEKVNASDLR